MWMVLKDLLQKQEQINVRLGNVRLGTLVYRTK